MSGDSTTARLNTSTPDWAARKASVQGSPWLDIKVSRCQERVKVTLSTPYNLAPERANIEITNHNAISHHSLAGAGVSMVKGKADVVAWSLNFTMEDQFSCIRDLVAATSISLLLSLRETHWLVSWIARSWFCSLSFKIHTQKALLPSVRTRRRSQVWLIINKTVKIKCELTFPPFPQLIFEAHNKLITHLTSWKKPPKWTSSDLTLRLRLRLENLHSEINYSILCVSASDHKNGKHYYLFDS